jgi:hypothetical protein
MTRTVRIGLLALLLALAMVGNAAAQTGLTYFISDVDSTTFPTVHFKLRAVDLANKAVSGLNSSTLTVFENGEQVSGLEVTPHGDGPITYIFVLDQGTFANYVNFQHNNMRQVITSLVSGGYFVDGRDTVMVLGRYYENSDQTVTWLPATQTATDLTTWVASFGFDRGKGRTKGHLGIEDAIRNLGELVPVPGSRTTAIIYITRYIEDPTGSATVAAAQNTAASARTNYTSIYVLQTDANGVNKDALQVLADGSNGQYAVMTRSTFPSVVSSMYQAIAAQRTYYEVSYRSPVGAPGPREITLNTPERPGSGVIGNYEVALQPAAVTITEPVPQSTILREARYSPDGTTLTYDANSVRVVAELSWPDGFPRNISTAQLLVNGNVEGNAQVEPDQTRFTFDWDFSDIITPGTNAVTLEVRMADEVGMLAEAEQSVNIEVIIPPTPEPAGPAITPSRVALAIPVLCILGAVAAVVLGGGFYLLRSRTGAPRAAAPSEAPQAGATMMASDVVMAAPLATLTVLEGPKGMVDEVLKVYGNTTLGRNPAQVSLAFYADEESSVSRLHAAIDPDPSGDFNLTDRNSSAGTRLNGRQIQAGVPVTLEDGDEIVLGDLARRGVKLRFNLATGESVGPYSGSADDRTHLVGDRGLPDWGDPPLD